MTAQCAIMFAGGGTGGHIFPNVAIFERLRAMGHDAQGVFAVSQRPLDEQMLAKWRLQSLPLPVKPLTIKPTQLLGWYGAWRASVRESSRVLREQNVPAVVATGGFVSGPVVVAAKKMKLPIALVNLDAVPGKANRYLARSATKVFSVYDSKQLPGAQIIGLPLRRAAIGPENKADARLQLGLDTQRPTLLVIGGSQGAQTIDQTMIELSRQQDVAKVLCHWQVFHIAGGERVSQVIQAYAKADIPARVEPFCEQVGLAWSAATLAISRAGANSVAEAWANATPTIFLPYPHHKDQHQQHNAQPLADVHGAVIVQDRVDPLTTAKSLKGTLLELLTSSERKHRMVEILRKTKPADGSEVVAQWLAKYLVTDREK